MEAVNWKMMYVEHFCLVVGLMHTHASYVPFSSRGKNDANEMKNEKQDETSTVEKLYIMT
jgi:hypothetical protein